MAVKQIRYCFAPMSCRRCLCAVDGDFPSIHPYLFHLALPHLTCLKWYFETLNLMCLYVCCDSWEMCCSGMKLKWMKKWSCTQNYYDGIWFIHSSLVISTLPDRIRLLEWFSWKPFRHHSGGCLVLPLQNGEGDSLFLKCVIIIIKSLFVFIWFFTALN